MQKSLQKIHTISWISKLNNFSILGFVIFSMIGYMANEKNINVADATADGKIQVSYFSVQLVYLSLSSHNNFCKVH